VLGAGRLEIHKYGDTSSRLLSYRLEKLLGIGRHRVNPGERALETGNRQATGPQGGIAAAQQSNLRSAQTMAIGDAKQPAIPFGGDAIQ
jgi:hypothetical protein